MAAPTAFPHPRIFRAPEGVSQFSVGISTAPQPFPHPRIFRAPAVGSQFSSATASTAIPVIQHHRLRNF